MPDVTPNLGLKKPTGNERVTRANYTENLDIMDAAAVKKGEGIAELIGGTLADRPAPGVAGRYYFAQDTGAVYLDTGEEWILAAASQGDVTALQSELMTHKAETMQDADITVMVGSGGDFSNINDALTYLSRKHPEYKKSGIKAEIKLLSGFVMQEQVLITGLDLGWITITSVDAVVNIDKTKLVEEYGRAGSYPAFCAYQNSALPVIGALFDMQISGEEVGKHGICAIRNSSAIILPDCGVINVGGSSIYAYIGSVILARGANASGAGYIGVHADMCCTIDACDCNASGAGAQGVNVYHSSIANIQGGNARKGAEDSTLDILTGLGSLINAFDAIGGLSQAANTLTCHGIIFK